MKFKIIALLCLVLSIPAIAQDTQMQEVIVPLSKPNETGSLDISLVYGSIKVTGTKGKEVIVKATPGSIRNRSRENVREVIVQSENNQGRDKNNPEDVKAAQREAMRKIVDIGTRISEKDGLKRIPNDGMNLTITEQNNSVQINNESVNRPVHLEIQVPQNFDLKLSTVNNGDIVISNVNGNFELGNVNGSIILENVSGSAMANTTNGKVKANFVQWNSKNPMAFSTLNGNVDITLPANSKFNVKLDSDRGQIYSDFDIDAARSRGEAGKRTASGVYKVTMADAVTGQVNGGGPEIMMKNMNGNIYLRRK